MGWISIKEYTQKHSVSDSTIRRHIKSGKIRSKMVDGKWFLYSEDSRTEEEQRGTGGFSGNIQSRRFEFPNLEKLKNTDDNLSEVIAFSSKALNSYLMISDKLTKEYENRIKELDEVIAFQKQKIVELESYIKTLEWRKG